MIYIYIFYWLHHEFEGPSEGEFMSAERCKDIPDALDKAKSYLKENKDSKVEIVQTPEPLPKEFLT